MREQGTGRTQILGYHIIQSFKPDEITPEQVLAVSEELCDRFLKGNYQYVLAVHSDKDHLHAHIVFNNTNVYNGLSFTYEENQGGRRERAWAKLRTISDDICRKHNLSVIAEPEKGQSVSHFERDMQLQGKSWKDKLRAKIAEVAYYSKDFSDFLQRCAECGVEYVYKPSNKVKLKFRLSGEGQQRFTRADTLGEDYTAERIVEQIEQIQKSRGLIERLAEKKNTEKPMLAPKSEPIETSTIITAEKFINGGEKVEPIESKPTESQAPEKKEDVWAEIRDMRGSDTMIANLEAGGITSLDDLRSFFWNTHHNDDHTDELAKLNAKIEPIDKLIKMMKQRTKYSATYKEYQERSAFTQSNFRKKNAAAIDAYEEADKYITEHIKAYYIKGKPPKQSDLQAKSTKLKEKYNALLPEHNAFLRRQSVASQYTRQVRQYLDSKRQQERNRQYQEKKRSQQRNKNAIE